jgi:predicted nucleic acid-binding protein
MELYPNPFTTNVVISFDVQQQGNTKLTIMDLTGKELKTVMSDMTPSGKYTYNVDMSNLSDGMYLAVLKKEDEVEMKRAIKATN